MPSSQDRIFAAFEGDNWFKRNKASLERMDPQADIPLRLLELFNLRPQKVLEVGAANGVRLAEIHERFNSKVVAVDLSKEAMVDGKLRFPFIEFVRGIAYAIPLRDLFDLVIVNFVFHWIDRTNLLRSVAEIDRLLADEGFLIIGDFHPSNFMKVRYHHLPGQEVYTYKQNYAATFLASGLYHPVGLLTGDHSSKILTGKASEDERSGAWLLRKMLKDHYIEGSFSRKPGL